MKALAVCNHPGGARVVLPVVETFLNQKSKIEFDLFLTRHSAPIFGRLTCAVRQNICEETIMETDIETIPLQEYAFIVTGTSIHGNLEKTFIKQAKKKSVATFSILDHWCEYTARFCNTKGFLDAVPDVIFVPDIFASDDLETIGVDSSHIQISGHPAFDDLSRIKALFDLHKRKLIFDLLGLEMSSEMVVFVSEPVSSDYGYKRLTYSESTVLRSVLDILQQIDYQIRPQLVVKMHPREDPDKFAMLLRDFPSLKIKTVDPSVDRYDLMLSAKLILGIDSIMLLEASILGVSAHSVQIGYHDDSFIGLRLGWVQKVKDDRQLLDLMLKNIKHNVPVRKLSLAREEIFRRINSSIHC